MRNLRRHNTKTTRSSTESMNRVLAYLVVHVCVREEKTEKINCREKRVISLKAEKKRKKGKGKKKRGDGEKKRV